MTKEYESIQQQTVRICNDVCLELTGKGVTDGTRIACECTKQLMQAFRDRGLSEENTRKLIKGVPLCIKKYFEVLRKVVEISEESDF